MAIYKSSREVELGATENYISQWSERDLNPQPTDFKSDALTTRPRCLPSRKLDYVTSLLHQLNWPPVKQLLYYRDAVLTYKCFNGFAPKYLVDTFTKRSSIHTRHTRNRDLLHTGEHTFAY